MPRQNLFTDTAFRLCIWFPLAVYWLQTFWAGHEESSSPVARADKGRTRKIPPIDIHGGGQNARCALTSETFSSRQSHSSPRRSPVCDNRECYILPCSSSKFSFLKSFFFFFILLNALPCLFLHDCKIGKDHPWTCIAYNLSVDHTSRREKHPAWLSVQNNQPIKIVLPSWL